MNTIVETITPTQLENLSRNFSGRILLRKEIPLNEPTFQQLLDNQYLIPQKSIIKKLLTQQCMRCGNEKKSLFAKIPCSICNKTHLYCRKCIQMGRVMECEPLYTWGGEPPNWSTYKQPCTWDGTLTQGQLQASNHMVQAIRSGEKEYLIWAVCGAGKTEMIFPAITETLQQGKRICIATPRADVVRELYPRLQKAFEEVPVQALYGGSETKDATAQLIIATTHQLLRFQHAFDVVIVDEIDAFPFHADPSLPYSANRAKKQDSTMIYLTATPRKDHQKRIAKKTLPHTFVPVRFHGHPLPVPKTKICFSLKKDLDEYRLPKAFYNWLPKRENSKRQLLIFVPTIKLAEKMKDSLASILKKEKVISSEAMLTSVHAEDVDREEKVIQFRQKKITVMITTTILERGVTFPSVDVAIVDAGHSVFDEAALVQIAGRAGRSADDPIGEVIFFHDGKTEAMERAIASIKKMNKRGGFET